MNTDSMIGVGVLLIIAGVLAAFVAQPMYEDSIMVSMFESMSRGAQMRRTADLLRFGGIGAGAIGVALLIAGLVKKSQPTDRHITRDTEFDAVQNVVKRYEANLESERLEAMGINVDYIFSTPWGFVAKLKDGTTLALRGCKCEQFPSLEEFHVQHPGEDSTAWRILTDPDKKRQFFRSVATALRGPDLSAGRNSVSG